MAADRATEIALCGCDCCSVDGMPYLVEADDNEPMEMPWIQCECVLCGLGDEGRCQVRISPRVMIFRSIHDTTTHEINFQDDEKVFCGQCRQQYLLESRREAVKRSRENQKPEDEQCGKSSRYEKNDTEHSRAY